MYVGVPYEHSILCLCIIFGVIRNIEVCFDRLTGDPSFSRRRSQRTVATSPGGSPSGGLVGVERSSRGANPIV